MKTELTPPQIESYRENGFIVIEDWLTPTELESWREAVMDAVTTRCDRKLDNQDWKSGDSFYDKVFIQRINLWKDNEKVRRLMLDPRIGRLACELEGIDGIRVWHDQALIKAPWANATAWHLDDPYWSFDSRHAISIWIALDDATLENGCLFFIPGTHKTARFDNANIGENMSDLFKIYPEWKTLRSVAAPMRAGSCSFHNGLLAHGAHANMTPGWRRAMTCAFMPDGSTFNGKQNILTKAQLAKLKVGDVLADDAQNPLLYKV